MDFFKKASASFAGGNEADLLKQAEGFMGSHNSAPQATAPPASTPAPAAGAPPASAPPAAPPATPAPAKEGYSEVYGSAQTLYQGLQDKLSGKQTNVDDQQLAGAAANVLKAAENSGFAKDSQYADYFSKADTYLQNYGKAAPSSGAPPAAAPPAAVAPPAAAPPAAAPPAAAPPAPQ